MSKSQELRTKITITFEGRPATGKTIAANLCSEALVAKGCTVVREGDGHTLVVYDAKELARNV